MGWRRALALAVPLALVFFALGFLVGLEAQRGPNWRLELDGYIASHWGAAETVAIEKVVKASRPWRFKTAMGTPLEGDWIRSSSPAQEVRCVLLRRSRASTGGDEGEDVRQVVFLVHHSDALYRVGWLAYEGPEEPFDRQDTADLESIGCDLGLR